MGKTIIHLVFIFAIAAAVACDDDNGTPTTPTTVTQTGAFAPQPVPPSTFPSSPASPSSLPAAPNGPSAPNHPPAPNHPIFGDVNAVTGVCPAIRLTVGGRVVVTERSTIFVIACRSIRTKTRVRISGRFTPAGTMIASVVEPTAR